MMRSLLLFFLPALASATIWPDNFGAFHRLLAQSLAVTDQAIWNEYGFQEAEEAQYENGEQRFRAIGYRFQDSTGALAAFQWQRPADAKPSTLSKLAAETHQATYVAHGSYLLVFQGRRPEVAEIAGLIQALPKLDQSPLPALAGYLPAGNRVPNSERYIMGPAGLQQFDPRIPASTAAFHLGSEAQIGDFRAKGGDMKLAIFSYPTPQIAMQRVAEFDKIPQVMAKRSGPLVAVIVDPPDADEAERLLSLVRYEASITWSERVPTRRDNIGDLIINAFILIAVLLAFSAVAGLAFGGLRMLIRRGGGTGADAMIVLHLEDRKPYP